jgi:ubiquinone/menaquinone biosynthesis C-methylase UbiE
MYPDFASIKSSIPPSQSDKYLNEWGYDLLKEYYEMIEAANLTDKEAIFEFATGSGRMTSLLTRLNFKIITGDISFEGKSDAEKRITKNYFDRVKYVMLNLENIPFPDNSLKNIVCVNTLHHLNNPIDCVKELIRTHSSSGKLVLADFNDEGFEVMDKLHKVRYHDIHPRGEINWEEVKSLIFSSYRRTEEIKTQLNIGITAYNKG